MAPALSGRNVGRTTVSGSGRFASSAWYARSSTGSSVVQTVATRNCLRSPCVVNPGSASFSFVRSQTSAAVHSSRRMSIPNGRFSSMCVQW